MIIEDSQSIENFYQDKDFNQDNYISSIEEI
jgi:hypothetical protein